jgi:mevalonate kinase
MHVPGLDSEEMNTIQTVLGVLGIYWAPLRRLVRIANAPRSKTKFSGGICVSSVSKLT